MKTKSIISKLFLLATLVILCLLPLAIKKTNILTLIVMVFLYVSLASSWNILGGYAGQTNLGHAAFFGLGSLVTRLTWFAGWPLPVSLLAGSLVALVFGLIIGIPAFKLKGVYFAIGTLALAQILFVTTGNMFPTISSLPAKMLITYDLTPRYYVMLGLAVITVGASYLLIKSRTGLGLMAVREGEEAAESLGVNAMKHKLIALSVSSFLAGLTGGAFAFYHVGYYPQFPFAPVWTFDTVTMAYVGGTGTLLGPIIGAVLFVLAREWLVLNVGEWHLIIFGTLFILVVLFLPGGFMELWEKFMKAVRRKSRVIKPISSEQKPAIPQ